MSHAARKRHNSSSTQQRAAVAAPVLVRNAQQPPVVLNEDDQPIIAPAKDAYTAAVQQLRALLPTLHEHPDIVQDVRHVLQLADARRVAIATGNARTGIGMAAVDPSLLLGASFTPDLLRGGGNVSSPTGSTPQASSPSGQLGGWAGSKDQPKGVMNARVLRNFARDPWVFAAMKHRADKVARARIDVLPLDYDRPYDRGIEKRMKRLLACPNVLRDSYASLMRKVVFDILTLDRGCLSKAMTPRREPVGLFAEDGATIKIYANWDGNPRVPRYLYEEPGTTRKVPLRNDELICIMESETTYSFGLSRVQILLQDIEADIEATSKAKDFVLHKPAQHAIHLQGVGQQAIDDLRSDYETLVAGKREILFLGSDGPMQAQPLVFSLKDQQFMEWQTYLARKICAVFQVSPQSIGITFDINRATSESQQEIEDEAGNIPLLLLIEEYFNRELMWDYADLADDGRPDFEDLNLGIFFPEISEASRIMHIERLVKTVGEGLDGGPFLTPNEAREMLGEEPMDGGNTLYVMSPTNGPMPWLSYDGETGDFVNPYEGGAIGDQTPGSGPDENERELDDTTQSKPAQQQGQSTGDETSGTGGTPNMPADGDGSGSGASSGGTSGGEATKGYNPDTAPIPLERYRRIQRDGRRPGQAWSPVATYGVRALAAGQQKQAPRRTRQQAPAEPPDVTASLAQSLAMTLELLQRAKKPDTVGHVDPIRAQAHHKPHAELDAKAKLEAQVKSIFEGAQQRGHLALTSPSSAQQ